MAGRPRGSASRISSSDPEISNDTDVSIDEPSPSRVEQVMSEVSSSSLAVGNNALSENEIALLPPDVYHARMFARVQAEARSLNTNNIEAGGRFFVDGAWVNANGEHLPPPEE